MDASEDLAPAVTSILAAARDRPAPAGGPIDVDARPLSPALERAERRGDVPVITEVKPTSPTTTGTRGDDPVELATAMERAGASAISVLTEPQHFDGTTDDLAAIRSTVEIPVLRKDFIVEEAQLDAVASDLVLLIARFLDDDLADLIDAANRRGFQPLVEVHTVDELERAVAAGATIVGINNRDLARLEVDLDTFEQVAPAAPDHLTLVAESGINDPDDVRRMRAAGADALLVGSAIMAGDIADRTARLVGAER